MTTPPAIDIHTPAVRQAGRDWLSLALMDARNRSLRWIAELSPALSRGTPADADIDPPAWTLGHIAWYQEAWIARNVQRRRGAACDPSAPRLPSVLAQADALFDPDRVPAADRRALSLPGLDELRQYLADTIDITLDLLAASEDSDEALYFFRLAVLHEDLQSEALAVAAQTLGVPQGDAANLCRPGRQHPPREPLGFPATRWLQGSPDVGLVLDNERPVQLQQLPEFEIDAQPVSWSQFTEFVEDGGYDDARWWTPEGHAWVQRQGRRTPRHVLQMRQGVLQRRFGRDTRVPLSQPVVHVSAHEAQAWCRWAGRRLPSELEWEVAAHQGAFRGFRWGEVLEWTATTFRPYADPLPQPDRHWSQPAYGNARSLRGASFATSGRLRDPKFRRHAALTHDVSFCGFRSCAL